MAIMKNQIQHLRKQNRWDKLCSSVKSFQKGRNNRSSIMAVRRMPLSGKRSLVIMVSAYKKIQFKMPNYCILVEVQCKYKREHTGRIKEEVIFPPVKLHISLFTVNNDKVALWCRRAGFHFLLTSKLWAFFSSLEMPSFEDVTPTVLQSSVPSGGSNKYEK